MENKHTEQKNKNMQEFIDAEVIFKLISEKSNIGIAVFQGYKLVYGNKIFEDLTGYSFKEYAKFSLEERLEFVHPEDRNKVQNHFRKKIENDSKAITSYVFRYYNRDGELRYFQINSTPVQLKGKPSVLAFYEDVTSIKKNEQRLIESEEKYRNLFNNIDDAIFLYKINPDKSVSNILEVNNYAVKMLGYTREELLELHPLDLVPEKYLDENSEGPNLEILLKQKHHRYEAEFLDYKGEIHFVEVNSTLFTIGDENYILSTARDITEKVKARKALRKEMDRKSILLDIITHDLNNYLTSIDGSIELIEENDLTQAQQEKFISIMKSSLGNATNLVNNISVFMKTNLDQEYKLIPISLVQKIKKAKQKMEEIYHHSNIKIEIYPQEFDEEITILADSLFEQVILNLLSNAIKHNSKRIKQVEIHIDNMDEYVSISICDNGKGIPFEEQSEIFERYGRFKRKGQGSGLGLYIVKNLIARYNGSIKVESLDSKDHTLGTKFIIQLQKS